jgi:hypothetical protein
MHIIKNVAVTSGALAGVLGLLAVSGVLFATPASAEVTGYDTGYAYNQGLAIGAGGALMANYSATGDVLADNTATETTTTVPPVTSTTVTTPATTDGSPNSVTVPVTTNAAQAPAGSFWDFSSPMLWLSLIVLLAIVALGVAALTRDRRTYATSDYQ